MTTHITFVLDSSGSMAEIEEDTKGGFNSFLDEQRQEEGDATVSLYDFNSDVSLVYEGRQISEAPKLDDENYTPSGRTALHDAISVAITETAEYIDSMGPARYPETVIIVVLTDGRENSSETPQKHVRDQVKSRRDDHDWEFLFIGANQDAALTASEMGMDRDHALDMSHSGEGARNAYQSTSRVVSRARREGSTHGYDESDRRKQDDSGES